MIEIRFHGRGGQGAVTSAELLAIAAIRKGKYAQAFPNFGPERRGAPVMAFLRIDDKPIRNRNMISNPDIVVVLDPSLLRLVDVASGLKEEGIVIANSKHSSRELRKELNLKHAVSTVNANKIAKEELGLLITNTTMLGSLLKVRDILSLDDMIDPLTERFGRIASKNIKALERAYRETQL